VPREDRLRARILAKPAEINFDDLRAFLLARGWHERPASGSHHSFWKEGVPEILTIPTVGGHKVKRTYIVLVIKALGLEE
jgi:predicted RNA binding protein YcfA (HicA-like mRNA interferase family)